MAKAAQKQAVAKVAPKTTAVATYDYGAYTGIGQQDITRDDMLMPFVRIIQQNSPELDKKDEKYIEGSEAGMFFNVSTRKLYGDNPDEGFTAHLCYKDRSFAEFIPRDSGGGFVGTHMPDDPVVVKLRAAQGKFGKLSTSEGNEIVETYMGFFVTHDEESPEGIVMPFSSTGITPFKQMLMMLDPLLHKGVPIFAPRLRIATRRRENKDGKFYVPVFTFDGAQPNEYLLAPDDELCEVCLDLRKSVESGEKKADFKNMGEGDGDDADGI